MGVRASRTNGSGGSSRDPDEGDKNKTKKKKKEKEACIDDADRAVLSLKTHRKKLERQLEGARRREDAERKSARALIQRQSAKGAQAAGAEGHSSASLAEGCAAQDRARARASLSRARMLANLCESLEAQVCSVDSLLWEIDSAGRARDSLRAMEAGNRALKAIQDELSVEKAEAVIQEYEDAKHDQERIDELVAGESKLPFREIEKATARGEDVELDEDLEAELEALEHELAEEESGGGGIGRGATAAGDHNHGQDEGDDLPHLPDVPSHSVEAAEAVAEEEVKEPAAEAASAMLLAS